MSTEIEEVTSRAPLELLLYTVTNISSVPAELTEGIRIMDALMSDLGPKMNDDMRIEWIVRADKLTADCEGNKYSLTPGIQKLYSVAIKGLSGRFYEIIAKDYATASKCYEDAADAIGQIQWSKELGNALPLLQNEPVDLSYAAGIFYFDFGTGTTVAQLWDYAGDAYYNVPEHKADAKRCYETGLGMVMRGFKRVDRFEDDSIFKQRPNTLICHLSISLANLLLSNPDNWEKAEVLYRRAADGIFFNAVKKENIHYQRMCEILGSSTDTPSVWWPHVHLIVDEIHKEKFARLKADLGQRALDFLKEDFKSSNEGFPVPETYRLVEALSDLYIKLGEYDKCVHLAEFDSDFGEAFYAFVWDQFVQEDTYDWLFPFVIHEGNASLAKGLLKRPDYKEFMKHLEKSEESHRRHEWMLIRQETKIDKITARPGFEEEKEKLRKQYPWLEKSKNFGSIINAELTRDNLVHQNWGEVVMGYCNAVEEELKRGLYDEYLKFRAEFSSDYLIDSGRREQKGSVLYFIADEKSHPVWSGFIKSKFLGQEQFLAEELPPFLSQLIELRNPSAHGKMSQKEMAERARKIVLGDEEKTGLLKRLIEFRTAANL